MTPINLDKWRIGLPIYPLQEVTDNSTRSEYNRCHRKGLYKYGMRRSFIGKSFPIQYGLAYHKYREVVEIEMLKHNVKMSDEIHDIGLNAAKEGWEDPPLGHRHEYLDLPRLYLAIQMARHRIEQEQKTGQIKVTRSEDSFDLELPFQVCTNCGWAYLDTEPFAICSYCEGDADGIVRARHGGRVDQFIEFNGGLYVRDWKTTGYMPKFYEKKFLVNAQVQGYVWAGGQLAGRPFNGGLIETVYNTKTKGPQILQHYVDFSSGQMEQWLVSQMMHEQFIRTSFARVKELGYLAFPQNTDACMAMGLCPYHDACQMGSGREIDKWLESNTVYSHWDFTDPDKEVGEV